MCVIEDEMFQSLYVRKSDFGPFQLLHYLEKPSVHRLNDATSEPYVKMNLSIENRHWRSINGSLFAKQEGEREGERPNQEIKMRNRESYA